MTIYILNERCTSEELDAIKRSASAENTVRLWPGSTTTIPKDIKSAILIVREHSTPLEEARAVAIVNAGVRIVCVYTEKIEVLSELAQKYCSAMVPVAAGSLAEALSGNDEIQQRHDGQDAPRNPQKPHNC